MFVVGSTHGHIKIYSEKSLEAITDLGQVHTDTVRTIRFNSNDSLMASGSDDKIIKLFELDRFKVIHTIDLHT